MRNYTAEQRTTQRIDCASHIGCRRFSKHEPHNGSGVSRVSELLVACSFRLAEVCARRHSCVCTALHHENTSACSDVVAASQRPRRWAQAESWRLQHLCVAATKQGSSACAAPRSTPVLVTRRGACRVSHSRRLACFCDRSLEPISGLRARRLGPCLTFSSCSALTSVYACTRGPCPACSDAGLPSSWAAAGLGAWPAARRASAR